MTVHVLVAKITRPDGVVEVLAVVAISGAHVSLRTHPFASCPPETAWLPGAQSTAGTLGQLFGLFVHIPSDSLSGEHEPVSGVMFVDTGGVYCAQGSEMREMYDVWKGLP